MKKNRSIGLILAGIIYSTPLLAIEVAQAIDDANDAMLTGDFARATGVLEKAIAEHRDNLELYNQLARVQLLAGNVDVAETILRDAISNHSDASDLFENLLKVNEVRVGERYRKALGVPEQESVDHVKNVAQKWQGVSGGDPNIAGVIVTPPTAASSAVIAAKPIVDENTVAQAQETNATIADIPVVSTIDADATAPADTTADAGQNGAIDTIGGSDDTATDAVDADSVSEVVAEVDTAADDGVATDSETEVPAEQTAATDDGATEKPEEQEEGQTAPNEEDKNSEIVQAVADSLDKWRKAWSARDAAAFVAMYVDDYSPNDDLSHAAWVDDRANNFKSKRFIEIRISDEDFNVIDDRHVRARFTQSYRSNNYQDKVVKRVNFVLTDGQWLIDQEISSPLD